jgi:hypothetical protein
MKLKIVLSLFIFSTVINGQNKKLQKENIVSYFADNNAFDALEKINDKLFDGYFIDYKSFYLDTEIKKNILLCLDRRGLKELEINKYMEVYKKNNLDIEYFKYSLKSYINDKKRKIKIDSLLLTKELINTYTDSILNHRYEFLKKDIKNSYEGTIPNLNTVVLFKYPEVYDSIKKWNKKNIKLDLFDELIKYNDPDAIKLFDKKVENYVKSNGSNTNYTNNKNANFSSFIRDCNTSYTFSKVAELIKIDHVEVLFYGHHVNINGETTSNNIYVNENFSILNKVNFFTLITKYKLPYEKLIKEYTLIKSGDLISEKKFMNKNNKTIKKAILDISEEMKKEEEYWMKNMPFYKKK